MIEQIDQNESDGRKRQRETPRRGEPCGPASTTRVHRDTTTRTWTGHTISIDYYPSCAAETRYRHPSLFVSFIRLPSPYRRRPNVLSSIIYQSRRRPTHRIAMSNEAHKADQIAFRYYNKLASVVHAARATTEPNPQAKVDKWVRSSSLSSLSALTIAVLSSTSKLPTPKSSKNH